VTLPPRPGYLFARPGDAGSGALVSLTCALASAWACGVSSDLVARLRLMRLAALAIRLAALSTGLFACSSGSSGPTQSSTTPDTTGLVSCDDPRQQAYAPGMQQLGASGVFTFVLVSSSPAPPAYPNDVFVLRVMDASGQPVTGATVVVEPTMPTMSHGTSKVGVTSNPDGSYTLQPLYLFMGGLWEIAIHATVQVDGGSQQDTTSFFFCVPG
jgi:hypothetical protein